MDNQLNTLKLQPARTPLPYSPSEFKLTWKIYDSGKVWRVKTYSVLLIPQTTRCRLVNAPLICIPHILSPPGLGQIPYWIRDKGPSLASLFSLKKNTTGLVACSAACGSNFYPILSFLFCPLWVISTGEWKDGERTIAAVRAAMFDKKRTLKFTWVAAPPSLVFVSVPSG